MTLILTLAGWSGAALLLLTYGLASTARLDIHSATYQALNLAGALGLALNAVAHLAWPAVVLNTLWVAVGLSTLTRLSVDAQARRRLVEDGETSDEVESTEQPRPTSHRSVRIRRDRRSQVRGRTRRDDANGSSRLPIQLRRTRPAARAQGELRRRGRWRTPQAH